MTKNNYVKDWSDVIRKIKTNVLRIYKKEDIGRETPYLFDGWTTDFVTGENLIMIHTTRVEDDNGGYLSYVLNEETFRNHFDEVQEEI